jgi:nitrogen regulatory protein P-II 1
MKTIVAVVRTNSLTDVVNALEEKGFRGMTISEIRGIGEEIRLYRPYDIHNRIEIIVPDERVEEVAGTILLHAKTGFAGDGIIGVYPMDYMIKIRTGKKEKE